MNEMFGAKRKSYTEAFKLKFLLEILGTSAGREYRISEKIYQDRLVFAPPYCMALSSARNCLVAFCYVGGDGRYIYCMALGTT